MDRSSTGSGLCFVAEKLAPFSPARTAPPAAIYARAASRCAPRGDAQKQNAAPLAPRIVSADRRPRPCGRAPPSASKLQPADIGLEARAEDRGVERVLEAIAYEARVLVLHIHVEPADIGDEEVHDLAVIRK